jgi:hypothetical protein
MDTRINYIRNKFFNGGLCVICRKFRIYKVTYPMEGIRLIEYYCQEHFSA